MTTSQPGERSPRHLKNNSASHALPRSHAIAIPASFNYAAAVRMQALVLLGLLALLTLLPTCASPEQEPDWRWKQMNPNYRPPYPQEETVR